MIYAALSTRPEPVRDGVLDVNLNGNLVEQPARADWADLAGSPEIRQYRLRDLVAALDAASDDDRVKAVALDLDGFTGGGQTAIDDLAEAVRRVRAAGKPVVAYGVGYTDDSYQLAAAASEIWLNPLGAVLIAGPGGSNLYYKGLLDKLGVTANVYRVGTYKSAVEPLIRNDMSPEARQNYQALGDAQLETWRESVHRNRPKANVDLFLKDMNGAVAAAGGDMAKAALAAGLVDRIGERREFDERLAELGGRDGAKSSFARIRLGSYVRDVVDEDPVGPIGVVTVAGMIVDGKAGPGSAGGDTIASEIEDGIRHKGIKALVVRVDSPGGSVLASERIRGAILEAKAKQIPVVASMGNVAASGGYWVASAADYIYAEPSTITGSIGVFGVFPSFQGTLKKLGIGADGVKTTPLSGEPDLFKGPSPEASRLIQTGVNSIYGRFLGIVAQARHKTPQQVDAIGQGRVWDGGTARQLGLVDGFGGMEEAVGKAAELARLGDNRGITYLEPPRSWKDELLDALASEEGDESAVPQDAFAAFARDSQHRLAAMIAEVRAIVTGPGIQVRCLECPPVAPPARDSDNRGLWGLLKAWMS
jgi:protease-4